MAKDLTEKIESASARNLGLMDECQIVRQNKNLLFQKIQME